MDWVKKTALLLSIFLSIATISFAQGDLRKAKKYIELQDFDSAINTLLRLTASEPDNQEAHIAIGNAYRLSNRLPEAHAAFSKAAEISELPRLTNKAYGDVLMAMKDYQGALEQYSLYGIEYPEVSRVLIDKCSYAIEHANDRPGFQIMEEYVNTSKRDFGPTFFGDEVVYLSSRTDMGEKEDFHSEVKVELLIASKDSKGMMKYPKRIKSLTGQNFNIAAISYNPVLEMVAVTKGGQFDNIHLTTEDKCTLYIGRFDQHGSISKLKPYEFNLTDYSTGFASFSPDGQTMYFASDRKDGFGGFDIYESKLVGGEWSAPINLGKEINTSGNEITPSRAGELLFFASDYRAGFGGFDLFKAYEGPVGFVNTQNLGTGINTSFDEYGMIYDIQNAIGYITSTRTSGKGMEDIFRVNSDDVIDAGSEEAISAREAEVTPKAYEILKGMIVDNRSSEALANITIEASTDDGSTIVSAKTNDKGMFSIPLLEGEYYNLKFDKNPYLTSSRTVKMEKSRKMPLMKIAMEMDPAVMTINQPSSQNVALGGNIRPRPESTIKDQSIPATSNSEALIVPGSLESKKKVVIADSSDFSLAEESSESYTFVAPTKVEAFAIQIAAISKNEKPGRFANVKDLGSLYTLYDSKVYKVRCGLFSTREEAEEVLRRVKVRGYETAFIVVEKPSDSMDLVMMDFKTYTANLEEQKNEQVNKEATTAVMNKIERPAKQKIATSYKVRLATYTNPKWFDPSKVEGPEFGAVEVLSKNGKSIYLLAGFMSLEAATKAHQLALSKGFKDAYVVKDNDGIMSKVN